MVTDFRHKLGLGLAIVLLLERCWSACSAAAPIDVEVGYSYVRANAGPGVCGCFNMNGLNGGFTATIGHGVSSIVSDIGAYFNGNVDNSSRALHMQTFLFEPRYSSAHFKRWTPYGQFFDWRSSQSGSPLWPPTPTLPVARAGLALSTGGGLEFNATQHFSIRVIQAEYLMTRSSECRQQLYQNNVFEFRRASSFTSISRTIADHCGDLRFVKACLLSARSAGGVSTYRDGFHYPREVFPGFCLRLPRPAILKLSMTSS